MKLFNQTLKKIKEWLTQRSRRPCSSWTNAERASDKSLDSVTPAKAGDQDALNNLDCGHVRNDLWVRINTNAPEKVSSDSPNELICQYCSDFIVVNNPAFEIIRE